MARRGSGNNPSIQFVLLLIVLAGLYYGGMSFLQSSGREAATKKAEDFLRLVDERNYNKAYDEIVSENAKKLTTKEVYNLNLSVERDVLGQKKERVLERWAKAGSIVDSLESITLYYRSAFEKDESVKEIITLTKGSGKSGWLVETYHANSAHTVKY